MNIKVDSRKIKQGDIFIAIRESENDGHKYIEDAIKRGASKIICEEGNYEVETIHVPNTHDYLISYLKEHYYSLIKDIKLIGVTGTNGKTTTCFLIQKALNKLGHKCGYIGTIGFYIDDKIRDLNNTTPDILDLYELLIECKENNCEYVTMEVSSHALDKKRVSGLEFDYAIFTNLTQDHLDYHHTFEEYALAKQALFRMIKKDGYAIINNDDDYKRYFMLLENQNIRYGFNDCCYKIYNEKITDTISTFSINLDDEIVSFESNLLGKHNIYNLACMIIVFYKIGISINDIKTSVESSIAPSGRMDTIFYKSNRIIIDYAHTPDAMINIINAVKAFATSKVYVIIGCGGNRDKIKRPIMAKIATDLADYAIFTSDNPRGEDAKDIISDMIQNLDKNNYEIDINREEAIKKGIQLLKGNDILLILGKGHENYQIIGNQKFPFDDKKIVLDLI